METGGEIIENNNQQKQQIKLKGGITMIDIETLQKLMFTSYPDLVDVEQMQEMLSINRHTAYGLIGNGEILAAKVGRKYRIPKIEILKYLYRDSLAKGGETA